MVPDKAEHSCTFTLMRDDYGAHFAPRPYLPTISLVLMSWFVLVFSRFFIIKGGKQTKKQTWENKHWYHGLKTPKFI
jgi:hypothetical protein